MNSAAPNSRRASLVAPARRHSDRIAAIPVRGTNHAAPSVLEAAAAAATASPVRALRRRLALPLLLATLALCAPAAAQLLPIFNLTTDDGLAASQVWDVLRDRRGYLWIATSQGLTRYDGFELVSLTGAEGLRNQVVRKVVEAPDGALWLATADGLARYDGRALSFIGNAEGMRGGIVWDLAFDAHGNLWFGTGSGGLGVVVGDRWKQYGKGSGLAGNDVYGLHVTPRGELWVGTRRSGVARCTIGARGELGQCRAFTTADGLANDGVRAMASDRSGNVWLGTRGGGLSRWDGRGFTTFTMKDGLADDDIYALLVRRSGELVIGNAQRGVTICALPDVRPCRTLRKGNGLAVDSVVGVDEDSEGNLWVGLDNGLSKVVSEKLQSFDDRQGVPGPGGYSLLPEKNGDIWVASYGGLGRIRLAAPYGLPMIQRWDAERGLPSSEVWDVLRDRRDRLWVGTARGLCLFDGARGCSAVYGEEQGLAGSYVLDLFEAKNGDLWVGLLGGASRLRFDDAGAGSPEVLTLRVADGLPAEQVLAIAEDRHGTIWLAGSGGLAAFRGDVTTSGSRVRAWTAAQGVPNGSLYGLFAARDGEVWIGAASSGLLRFRPPANPLASSSPPLSFTRFGRERGIDARAVFAVREDARGRLWLTTTSGVYHFDPRADGGRGAVLRRFDRSSGLVSNDSSTGNSLALDEQGRVWAGFSGGITRYDPALEEAPLSPPRTSIERVTLGPRRPLVLRAPFTMPPQLRAGEQWLDASAPLVVERGRHNVRFDFRGLSYRAPHELRYEVQLVGFDPDWLPVDGDPFKEYTNLDPGEYRFQVRAAAPGATWGPPAMLRMSIEPAFWQTPLFAAAALVAALLLLGIAHRLRTQRIKTRAQLLEAQVDERTDDLRRYARALEEHSHALDRANARIRQTNRFKSQFLANMSHELRTPLNAIIGFSQVLERRLAGRVEERELGFLRNVLASGRHLLHLIDNLLDLSKIEAGKMEVHAEEAELRAVVDGVCTIMEGYRRERDVTIVPRLPPHLVPIAVDVPKLKQILFNLLSNAIKFSPAGGTVEIEAKVVSAAESPLAVDSYLVSVIDHGVGIPLDDQARIFEEFRQVHHGGDRPAGTGLGLAIVYRFTQLLGGEVDLDSEPGEGAAFRVLLPRDASRGPATLPDEATAEAHVRPRVLVVEADREAFAALAEALDADGMLPVRARHGEEALRMAREVRPAVVAVDVGAPGLDGWAALAELQSDLATAQLPVVLVSLRDRRRLSIALGFDAWLPRPVDAVAFVESLMRLSPPAVGEAAAPVLVVDDDPDDPRAARAGAGHRGPAFARRRRAPPRRRAGARPRSAGDRRGAQHAGARRLRVDARPATRRPHRPLAGAGARPGRPERSRPRAHRRAPLPQRRCCGISRRAPRHRPRHPPPQPARRARRRGRRGRRLAQHRDRFATLAMTSKPSLRGAQRRSNLDAARAYGIRYATALTFMPAPTEAKRSTSPLFSSWPSTSRRSSKSRSVGRVATELLPSQPTVIGTSSSSVCVTAVPRSRRLMMASSILALAWWMRILSTSSTASPAFFRQSRIAGGTVFTAYS